MSNILGLACSRPASRRGETGVEPPFGDIALAYTAKFGCGREALCQVPTAIRRAANSKKQMRPAIKTPGAMFQIQSGLGIPVVP